MIREQTALVAVLAVVVVSLLAATQYASPGPAAGSTTTATTSFTTTSSTVSMTSASSFSFSPSAPLQVLSVNAQTTKDNATGKVYLTLYVAYKNIDGEAVYVARGCGSALTAAISSTSVVAENPGVRCLCAEFMAALNPGDSGSALTPGCWSGVTYQVLHPGTISVEMTLSYWSGQNQQNSGKTTIQASFTLE